MQFEEENRFSSNEPNTLLRCMNWARLLGMSDFSFVQWLGDAEFVDLHCS